MTTEGTSRRGFLAGVGLGAVSLAGLSAFAAEAPARALATPALNGKLPQAPDPSTISRPNIVPIQRAGLSACPPSLGLTLAGDGRQRTAQVGTVVSFTDGLLTMVDPLGNPFTVTVTAGSQLRGGDRTTAYASNAILYVVGQPGVVPGRIEAEIIWFGLTFIDAQISARSGGTLTITALLAGTRDPAPPQCALDETTFVMTKLGLTGALLSPANADGVRTAAQLPGTTSAARASRLATAADALKGLPIVVGVLQEASQPAPATVAIVGLPARP